MEEKDDLVVEGYRFATVADAEAARQDAKRVKNLEDNIDYRNPQNVLLLYNKALETGIFQTPVGFAYLLKIQEHLRRCGISEEKIRPVPLHTTFSNNTAASRSVRQGIAARKRGPEYKGRFITSVCLNLILIIAVAAMFFISFNSEIPNIINYRREIINEYSEWEQELTERENAVREAEREYRIVP